jgi:TetR/AcrR family transcriptional regulator
MAARRASTNAKSGGASGAPGKRRAKAPQRPAVGGTDDPTTREHMLDVALEAFAELGYDGASTRIIASRAGVNQGLIPYYFGTKEALWREAVDRAFADLRAGLAVAQEDAGEADAAGAADRVEQLIRRFVRFAARRPAFVRLMNAEGKRDGPRMRWIVDHHVRPVYEGTRILAEQATPVASMPPGLDAAHYFYILVGAVTQLFHQGPEFRRLTGRDPADEAVVEAHADALVALFIRPQGEPT